MYLIRQGYGRFVLPWPAARELHLQREAQEGADQDDDAKYCHAGKGGLSGDGTDDVPGHQQLQAQQDGLAELRAEASIGAGLVMGEPGGGGEHVMAKYSASVCVSGWVKLLAGIVAMTR